MAHVVFCIIFFSALILCVLALRYFINGRRSQQQMVGLQILQALRTMVVHVQRHRGISMMQSEGTLNFPASLAEEKNQVTQAIRQVSILRGDLCDDLEWLEITSHWARLSQWPIVTTMENHFVQHCKLVANLMQLMADITVRFHVDRIRIVDVPVSFWHRQFILVEYIAQLRGVGAKALGVNRSSRFYFEKTYGFEVSFKRVVAMVSEPEYKKYMGEMPCRAVSDFISCTQALFFSDETRHLSSDAYFSLGTSTIDLLLESFDGAISRLYRQYNNF